MPKGGEGDKWAKGREIEKEKIGKKIITIICVHLLHKSYIKSLRDKILPKWILMALLIMIVWNVVKFVIYKKKKKKKNKKSKIIDPTEGKPENRQIKFNPKMSKQNCNKLSQLFCSFLVWLR